MNAATYEPPCDKTTLEELYFGRGMSQNEVALELGTTQKRVFTAMRHFGLASRVAAKRDQRGDKNHMWRGDAATYAAFHHRVESARGKPAECVRCGSYNEPTAAYEWANLTGNYPDPTDYARMCRTCHRRYDASR